MENFKEFIQPNDFDWLAFTKDTVYRGNAKRIEAMLDCRDLADAVTQCFNATGENFNETALKFVDSTKTRGFSGYMQVVVDGRFVGFLRYHDGSVMINDQRCMIVGEKILDLA